MDMISELGELAFATRLKRLSERLQRDVSRIYGDLDVHFEARWFTILYALTLHSPRSVTGLAKTLRLTHPAVNQLAAEMSRKGLILSAKSKKDERKRLLRLSAKGKKISAVLTPVWEEIRLATANLLKETGPDFLTIMERIEQKLDEESMYERVRALLKLREKEDLEILEYRPAWKKHFQSLNYQWLSEHFNVEKEDEKFLSQPKERIINKGGAVFFARLDNVILGTCALIRHEDGIFELAKMAVAPEARGRGISRRLAEAVIERAKSLGAKNLFLQTNPKLVQANRLYKQLGFRKTSRSPFIPSKYKRPTYTKKMKLV